MTSLFPPFEPDVGGEPNRRQRFARLRRIPIRLVAPNMVTLIALCCGLTSIRLAFDARWDLAIAGIVAAAILDAVDGRLARALKGTSRFGAELDSLADFVNFGVAPALLLYSWTLSEIKSLGWLAALLFAIAAALRLARFNSMLDAPRPDWQADFFTGMPAPMGALCVLLPLYIADFVTLPRGPELAVVVLVYVLFIGFMLVSTIPTFSGKKMSARVPRDWVLPLMGGLVVFVGLLVSYPFPTLSVVVIVYLIGLPLGWRHWRRLDRLHGASAGARAADDPVQPDHDDGADAGPPDRLAMAPDRSAPDQSAPDGSDRRP